MSPSLKPATPSLSPPDTSKTNYRRASAESLVERPGTAASPWLNKRPFALEGLYQFGLFCDGRRKQRRHALTQIRFEPRTHLRMLQRELHRRLQIAELAAAIETRAIVAISQHLLHRQQRRNCIG